MAERTPCPTCPWRRDQHAGAIPRFKLELAERLDATVSDQLGAPIFACHQSQPERDVVCVGWLWRYGWDSIAVRFMLMRRELSRDALELPDGWDERLHRTFDEVIEKLRGDVAESEAS